MKRTLPVEEFHIKLDPEYAPSDPLREQAALEVWRQYVLAHGWSIVEEPTIESHRERIEAPGRHEWYVIGLLVRTDETIAIPKGLRTRWLFP